NRSRSTASAPPAATRQTSAASSRLSPSSFISALSRPEAESRRSALREFEHTSSAKPADLCAGEYTSGFCSNRRTAMPCFARYSAASQPARPAPMTFTRIPSLLLRGGQRRGVAAALLLAQEHARAAALLEERRAALRARLLRRF